MKKNQKKNIKVLLVGARAGDALSLFSRVNASSGIVSLTAINPRTNQDMRA